MAYYCSTCEEELMLEVSLTVPLTGFTHKRKGNYKVARPVANTRTYISFYPEAKFKVIGHEGHSVIFRCYDCSRRVHTEIKDGEFVVKDGKFISGYFVCNECYEKYYKNMEFEDDNDEE